MERKFAHNVGFYIQNIYILFRKCLSSFNVFHAQVNRRQSNTRLVHTHAFSRNLAKFILTNLIIGISSNRARLMKFGATIKVMTIANMQLHDVMYAKVTNWNHIKKPHVGGKYLIVHFIYKHIVVIPKDIFLLQYHFQIFNII